MSFPTSRRTSAAGRLGVEAAFLFQNVSLPFARGFCRIAGRRNTLYVERRTNSRRRSRTLFSPPARPCSSRKRRRHAPPTPASFTISVFPQNITHDELIANMRGFARPSDALRPLPRLQPPRLQEQPDFPSDAKPEKNVARAMMRMTRGANDDQIGKASTPTAR